MDTGIPRLSELRMGQGLAFLPGADAEAAPAPFSANSCGITSHVRNVVTDLWAPSAPRSRRAISSAWHAISTPKSRAFSSLSFVVLILLFAISYHMLPHYESLTRGPPNPSRILMNRGRHVPLSGGPVNNRPNKLSILWYAAPHTANK